MIFKWKFLVLIVVIMVGLFLWARFIGTTGLEVKEYKVIDKDLPISFYGLKIVHFTDLHYGRTIHKNELGKVVDKINLINPDIVVFTGDLVDKDVEFTNSMRTDIVDELSRINSTYGNYYVTGNHDKYLKDYEDIMEKSSFINLNDNYDIISSIYYENIFVGGVNSYITKKPSMNIVDEYIKSEDIPKFKVLLMHVPDNIKYLKDYNFNLVLAGHSHNGQIRLPFVGAFIKPEGAKKYYDEYYKINNTSLYISSGLGTSTLNIRLFNKPSINLYRVVNK